MKHIKGTFLAIAMVGAVAISACGGSTASTPKTKNAALVWCYNNSSTIDIDAPNAAGTSWSIRQLANITRDHYQSSRNRYSWASNETIINDVYGPSIVQTASCGTPASSSTLPAKPLTWCANGQPVDIDAPNAAGTYWSIRQLANITRDYYESSRNRYSWASNETVINDVYGPTISLVASCVPPTTVASAPVTTVPKNQPTTTIPAIEITATTQVVNVSQDIVQSLSDSVNKSNVVVPAAATQITCAAECVAAALAAAGVPDGGTVYVSVNGGPKQKLSATEANKISVGSAKSMTFSVIDSKGTETPVAVPLDRGDTPAAVPAATTTSGDSSGSGTTIAIALVIALIALGAGVTVIRRRKTTI
jgi:hypothetical protein